MSRWPIWSEKLNNLWKLHVIIGVVRPISAQATRRIPQNMATFKDPTRCFAPLEVVERLLEIRSELGFGETIYLERCQELTDFLDAYGFDIYAFATTNEKINYGDYRTPVVPGGERLHASLMAH
jgi:hypothetical protein